MRLAFSAMFRIFLFKKNLGAGNKTDDFSGATFIPMTSSFSFYQVELQIRLMRCELKTFNQLLIKNKIDKVQYSNPPVAGEMREIGNFRFLTI